MSKRRRKESGVEPGVSAGVGIATASPAKNINREMRKAAERAVARGSPADEMRKLVHGSRIKGLRLPTARLHVAWKKRAKALRQEHPDPKIWSTSRIAIEIASDYGVSPRTVYNVIRLEID
jgi:hypothetical protein